MSDLGPAISAGDGTKNTSDPRAREPRYENPGGVTSDSLAAESETFQERNPNSNPTGVTGASSTYTNTDTSGASRLNPAASASVRDDGDSSSTRYAEGLGGQADANPSGFTSSSSGLTSATGGVDNTGYQGQGLSTRGQSGSGRDADSGGYDDGSGQSSSNADVAPTYITNVVKEPADGPHGKNIQEGGFDGEAGNTLGAEPGSINDPGRAAVGSFQATNAKGPGGDGDHGTELDNRTRYDELGGDQRA